ncbi:hypothetical protein RJ639_046556 [Escallonia herrerae]|uniref:Integrase catalytic domain-containing protein n=1 Tax=Escallonia herrerae TaxID=1293975 RepID=A0AA89B4L9_9ASTE|nr:hypothetical protein RJ639_046556 [Escallonia herrerae]
MAVAPPSTYHSHLDPGDLHLHLTSRSSYDRKYRSTADSTFDPKEKGEEHMTKSGSCYRRDPSVEDSTNSSPTQAAEAETLRRSIHRKRAPKFCTRERDSWKVSDAVMCRAFPTILRKAAHAWFKSLQPRSIYSFGQLSDLFQKHFVSSRSRRKNSASLLNIVQEKNESLACFLGRFNVATLEIDNLDESMKYTAFLRGLRPTSKFTFSVNKSPPGNMKALLEKANKYIQAEEYLETHRDRRGEGKPEQKKRSREVTPLEEKSAKRSKRDERRPKDTFNLTPLNAKPSQILHEIKDNKALQWPDKMKSRPNKRNKDLWCHFHNDHGHTTDNCRSHKRAIEALIKRGQLRKFVAPGEGRQQTPPAMEEREEREENTAGNFDVKRVLIDNGSSAEILFHDAFKKRNIPTDRLRKMDTPLYGFSNHLVAAEDGSSALGSSGAGLILISLEGFTIEYALHFGFQASNNETEYEALLAGIRLAHALKVDSLSVHSDSQLMVNHVLGDYEARDERMAQYLSLVKTSPFAKSPAIRILRQIHYPGLLRLKKQMSGARYTLNSSRIALSVLKLSERHEARNLRVKAARYALVEGTLYKKSFSLPYLRCLRPSESIYAMQEVHEGICGQHLGGRTLAQKILRQRYYWPTMQRDAIEFTRRCDKCQKFAPISHTPVVPLTSIVSPIPFPVWGMDLLGPFPVASSQRRFVIVAIDYFTKWTEAESLATIISVKCEDFFWKNVVCHFGVP